MQNKQLSQLSIVNVHYSQQVNIQSHERARCRVGTPLASAITATRPILHQYVSTAAANESVSARTHAQVDRACQ